MNEKNGKFEWVKDNPSDKTWWKVQEGVKGEFIFSFDRVTEFNLFEDYPQKLSSTQKLIFDKENPYWADYFSDRS